MTMTLIGTTVLGGASSSVSFTSIPQTGTDLLLVWSARSSAATTLDRMNVALNGSTTGFTSRTLYGTGTTPGSYSGGAILGYVPAANFTANIFGSASILFPNYTAASNKTYSSDCSSENNGSSGRNEIVAGVWANTAAISSITLTTDYGSTFVANSVFSLYTITKGSGGATVA